MLCAQQRHVLQTGARLSNLRTFPMLLGHFSKFASLPVPFSLHNARAVCPGLKADEIHDAKAEGDVTRNNGDTSRGEEARDQGVDW